MSFEEWCKHFDGVKHSRLSGAETLVASAAWDAGRADLEKQLAKRDESLARCVEAVDAEPELPGNINDGMWYALKVMFDADDRYGVAEAFRIVVRETKKGIKQRVTDSLPASAQATTKVQQWQPIETAPKDGTNILLVNRIGNVATGLWQGNGEYEGWWLRGGNRPNTFFNHHYGPSYWMPLPEPPTEAIREEKEGE